MCYTCMHNKLTQILFAALTTSDLLFPYGDECTGICITFEPGEHATDLMELNQTYAFCEEPLHSISVSEGVVHIYIYIYL